MTRDELIQLLGWRLGDRTDMAARAMAELNYVQDIELEGHEWLPWFLEKAFTGFTTTAGSGIVTKPADFLQEIEDEPLFVSTSGGTVRLQKRDYAVLQGKEAASGCPELYAIQGDNYHLYPTPDAVYTLSGIYAAKDARMSLANVETLWLKHASDLVLAAVGKQLAMKHIQSVEMAAGFAQDEQRAWTRVQNKHTAIKEINRDSYVAGAY